MWEKLFVSLCIWVIYGHSEESVSYRCSHADIVNAYENTKNIIVPQEHILTSSEYLIDPPPLFTQPLRISIQLDNIFDDPYTCYKAGDVVPYKLANNSHVCRQEDILSYDKLDVLLALLSNAVSFFENIFTIVPINGNLKVKSDIPSQIQCDSVRIDPQFEFTGIPNVGYALFVTSRPATSDTTLAYARYCQTDNLGYPEGRPTVGTVNFAPYSIDLTPEGRERQLGIVIHEITHALGFSYPKFKNGFIKWQWTGVKWIHSQVPSSDILVEYYNPSIGHDVTKIKTKNTVDAARVHYGCSNLDGAELEDAGGQGTALSHWEQRIFQNEYMTGTSTPYPVYSNITFSLFKDMGWYNITDFIKKLDPFLWGRNMGCLFVNGSCNNWPLTNVMEGYRCTTDTPYGQCRFDFKGWAQCNINMPDPLDDGCHFYKSTIRTGCNLDTKLIQLTMDAGEYHGENARCFHSSTAQFPGSMNSFFRVAQGNSMQCYATTCSGPKKLKVGVDNIWYDCPYDGGYIYPIEFGGSIYCRPQMADVLCIKALDTDSEWPRVTRIVPRKAQPGDQVTIYGTNFAPNVTTVQVHAQCEDIQVLSDSKIIAKLPSADKFNSINALGLFSSRYSVVVNDNMGRNSHIKQAILIDVRADGSSINAFFTNLGIQPIVMLIIAIILMLLCCGCCGFWCYRSCRRSERKITYESVNLSN